MSLDRLLSRVAADLDELGAGWALVGGIAVSARTEPRFTADLDVAIATQGDFEAEALLRALLAKGYLLVALVEQTATGRLATARLRHPEVQSVVDLLFASSGIESEIALESPPLEVFPGSIVRVAPLPHLVAMKVLARDDATREQDRGDLRRLLAQATGAEVAHARRLLRLIHSRGYSRGKDLEADLERLEEEFGFPETRGSS